MRAFVFIFTKHEQRGGGGGGGELPDFHFLFSFACSSADHIKGIGHYYCAK